VAEHKWNPDLVRKVAQLLTGHKGSEALNRFAAQLVIGAARDKGFVDKQNENMVEVYKLPFVRLGHFNVLTRFSFESDAGRYTWDFASGVTEGQKLSGYASSKGRQSKWLGDGAKKTWEVDNITGVVLVGFSEGDVQFFHLTRDEFLARDEDRINLKAGAPNLLLWAEAWRKLEFQPTFASFMGR
jgi:hypothetical protein